MVLRRASLQFLLAANFGFPFYKISVQKQWRHDILQSMLRTPTLVVRVQLPLG